MEVGDVIKEYLAKGMTGAVATIAYKLGAAPRGEGAKMFVGEDGKFFGTVGGGCLEAEVWQEAGKVVKTGEARFVRYRMNEEEIENDGMICGGNVDIFLEPLLERHRDLYDVVSNLEKKGRRALIVTRFGKDYFSKSLIDTYGGRWGDPITEIEAEGYRQFFTEKHPKVLGDSTVIEPISIASTVYIFGAGHISRYLAQVVKMVDFNVVVIDDREEFANKERFPDADKVIVSDFQAVFDVLDYVGDVYVVIVTRGHNHDAYILEEALKKPSKYIGMIGSKRKIQMVYDYLRGKGIEEVVLRAVHAPIGVKINSETPQEIAVSIVAELIDIRGA
ncbi:MAG: XdhC family protein [Syntrophobacterales bacterium]|jgi:xanthine dehydrogenase accessory factor|nr:XdhC family protein [Syntrophobacterales bacterium]